jgi:hypothetical protein
MFDADKFMQTNITGPSSTTVLICPEGEFKAVVDDGDKAITARSFPGKDGKSDSHQMQVLFSILDDAAKAAVKRDKCLVPMTVWLDVDDNGNLDTSEGRNVGLGRLRKALGQNEGAWNPPMMKGKGPVMVKVSHRADPKDPSIKYAEVTRVSAIGT